MNLEVEFSDSFCIVQYGQSITTVPKPIGEAIQKMSALNKQLFIRIAELERAQS